MNLWKSIQVIRGDQQESFFLIAGPCVVESEDLCMEVAGQVLGMC